MFYQSILPEAEPYVVKTSAFSSPFPDHRHADIELHYCKSGSMKAVVDKKDYTVEAGELLLIGPMMSHMFPPQAQEPREVLTVILGVSFLKEHFSAFSAGTQRKALLRLSELSGESAELCDLLDQTAKLCSAQKKKGLLIEGNLYKICSHLIDIMYDEDGASERAVRLRSVASIDKALELTYYNYAEPITVEDAAQLTGYSKSSFCRVFKEIVGESFHKTLNRQRIKASERLLKETDVSISEIGAAVGFSETKALCRVFNSINGITPGVYRKKELI
ncbi:MAG: helix-turn-helix domain-containing protein [Clostridia bacterium]|nr:helix-turn-helix domain-containing protein [Clostridia bacterium]